MQIAAQSSDEEELYASLGTKEGHISADAQAEAVGVEAQVSLISTANLACSPDCTLLKRYNW